MTHIILEAPSGRYVVEVDKGMAELSKLGKVKQKELSQLLKDNERDVVGQLFLADFDERGSREVAAQFGLNYKRVQTWAFDMRNGRKMTQAKLDKLKKFYGVDCLM